MRSMRWRAALGVWIFAGCATVGSVPHGDNAARQRIAQLEDARWDGDGELEAFTASPDARVRARAAVALGRLPYPDEGAEVTRALLELLFDPNSDVRAAAAFALGMRGDASAADKLVFVALDHHQSDPDPLVRARAIEALSKLDRPEFHERVLEALDDSDPRVRLEAAQGASRWSAQNLESWTIDQALQEALEPGGPDDAETDRDVIAYLFFALERRKSGYSYRRLAWELPAGVEKAACLRGLRPAMDDGPIREAVTKALSDPDWRVAYEATQTLAASGASEALAALGRATANPNPHVRRGAWDAIGAWFAANEGLARSPATGTALMNGLDLAGLLAQETSRSVRVAMLSTLLPLDEQLATDEHGLTMDALEALAKSDQEWVGVVGGLARSRSEDRVALLARLTGHASVVVRGAAIEALATHPGELARAALRGLLVDPDNGIRLAAVLALIEMLEARDVEPLARCYETTHGDGTPEVRFNVLKALAKLGGDEAKTLTRRALFDENAFVRRTARDEYSKLAQGDGDTAELLARSLAARSPAEIARRTAKVATRPHVRNPIVDVLTSRGTMTFELFPDEAPLHVENFLARIESDYYDGLTFHRVVPDFVIQGGCYRGDGNGGGTWRGAEDSLRHEITPRKYVRGSLGMPRYDDIDSGGSQFFVTHRATPHLDGRYTIFGELREGFDVLDAIEVGDVIVDVVVR